MNQKNNKAFWPEVCVPACFFCLIFLSLIIFCLVHKTWNHQVYMSCSYTPCISLLFLIHLPHSPATTKPWPLCLIKIQDGFKKRSIVNLLSVSAIGDSLVLVWFCKHRSKPNKSVGRLKYRNYFFFGWTITFVLWCWWTRWAHKE